MTAQEKEDLNKVIQIQRELDDADVNYMCYYLKISLEEFYERYLFNNAINELEIAGIKK